MSLVESLNRQGNILFKHRGQIPLVLFPLAVPAVYFANVALVHPGNTLIVNTIAIVVSVLGAMVRGYTIGTTPRGTSGRNTTEQVAESINTTGIYSTVRHPLYLGNYLMWIGIVIYTLNFWFVVVVSLLYWIYYERIMVAEENFLETKFGQTFTDWSNHVPAFFPAFKKFIKPSVTFSFVSVLRREYSGWLATVVAFVYVDLLRNYFIWHVFEISKPVLIVLIATTAITLILRTLKHQTKLLNEEGRS